MPEYVSEIWLKRWTNKAADVLDHYCLGIESANRREEFWEEIAPVSIGKVLAGEAKRLAGYSCGQEAHRASKLLYFIPIDVTDISFPYAVFDRRVQRYLIGS